MTQQQAYSHHRDSRAIWHYVPVLVFAMLIMTLMATQEAKGTPAYAGTGTGQAIPFGGTATATPQCAPSAGWDIVASPNYPNAANNYLNAVSALGPNDIWAVGYWYNNSPAKTLIEHWDGTQWSVIPSPNPGMTRNELYGVVAIARDDVWAVGHYFVVMGSDNVYQSLTLHWDGTAWTHIPSPNLGTWNNYLRAATAVSSNAVWAVGSYVPSLSSPEVTLTLHWNGTEWTAIAPGSNPGTSYNILYGVDALATNDVWAVGYNNTANGAGTLTYHWNGAQWNLVPSANGTGRFSRLNSVDAIAPNDVWAVGYNNPDPGGAGNVVLTLITHWDGTQWTQISSPSPATSSNYLYGVSAISASDIWAVGYQKSGTGPIQTLTLHWDGSAWSTIPSPNTATTVNWLTGVDAVSAADVWAVGYSGNASTLALHYTSTSCSTPTAPATVAATNTQPSTTTPTSQIGTATMTAQTSSTASITATAEATATLVATATSTCEPAWRVVNSIRSGDLMEVDAIAADDIWAVGASQGGTMALHWNGQDWERVPTPNTGSAGNSLWDVDAIAPNDVWAVGYYFTGSYGVYRTLTLHWDGTTWNIIPSPNIGNSDNRLFGVAALASDDVWAVGDFLETGTYRTLILHWDGNIWTRVPSPNVLPNGNFLYEIAAVAPNDIWAVGSYGRADPTAATLTLHWDGQTWSRIPSPSAGSGSSVLFSVTATAANDVWAVGTYQADFLRTLTVHWNGSYWSLVPSPVIGKWSAVLNDVTAISANDVWAVGFYNGTTNLTAHWDGTEWRVVESPTIGKYNGFNGVAAVSATDIWAVGHYEAAVVLHAHYSNACPTPSPTPTEPPTVTPTPVCTLQFIDVPPDHTFYPYIMCLACRGIVSGYDDGTFRPGNDVTRGQIAKIVSNAVNINDDPGPQIFEDVDSANPFYIWINRLANRKFMGGYRCGGEGEPCGIDRRSYFRPFSNATRGQLAKIVSNAAGLLGKPIGQFYTDVPEDNPFYAWITRLTELGVMSGYDCGGEGEPCDEENRPYFRPFNNVTRGQASKIVANTFFPNCQTPLRR